MNPSEPTNYYFNNNLAVASEKTEGVNLKGKVTKIASLIYDINYKATKK